MKIKRKKPPLEPREQTSIELFQLLTKVSEHYEMCAKLWDHVDGEKARAENAYRKAAENLERACNLMESAAEAREHELIALDVERDETQ